MMRVISAQKFAAIAVTAATLLSGCAQPADPAMPPAPTLAPPTPAGMEDFTPEPPRPADPAANTC
ncbi:MAG: ABC transporter substrate-binding protein, partial [Mycobacterium sp.]